MAWAVFARYSSSMGKRKKQQPNVEIIWEYVDDPDAEERLRRVFRLLLAGDATDNRERGHKRSDQLRLF